MHRSHSRFHDSCCSRGSPHFPRSISSSSVPCPPHLGTCGLGTNQDGPGKPRQRRWPYISGVTCLIHTLELSPLVSTPSREGFVHSLNAHYWTHALCSVLGAGSSAHCWEHRIKTWSLPLRGSRSFGKVNPLNNTMKW